jgi:hypothetical protein
MIIKFGRIIRQNVCGLVWQDYDGLVC